MLRVLITGSDGFIGKILTQGLKNLNYFVFCLDHKNGKDILDKKNFTSFKKIDTVFHLAAVVGYIKANIDPWLTYQVNVLGTLNVLEFCKKSKAKLLFPSAYLYQESKKILKDETDPIQPTNFYTHSKYLAEQLCFFYAKNYQVDVVIARTTNAYGPEQPVHYIIPLLMDSLQKKKTLKLTHPKALRDYLYIDDLINAYISLAKSKNTVPGEIFNVSLGKPISLSNLVNFLKKITASKTKIIFEKKLRENEVMNGVMNNKKIINKIGWQPQTSLSEGLRKIIQVQLLQKNFL